MINQENKKIKEHSIYLEDVSKSFVSNNIKTEILKDINFLFKTNTYSISGVSGTGKSTLLHIISGIEKTSKGNIYYNQKNINNLEKSKRKEILSKFLGLVFQYPYLINELTVLENIALKSLIENQYSQESKEQALDLLKKINLLKMKNKSPQFLSGGEKQRIAIARALFNKPKFLIADEPTAHLDKKNKHSILELILEYQKKWNMGLIIASHDPLVSELMQVKLELSNENLIQI